MIPAFASEPQNPISIAIFVIPLVLVLQGAGVLNGGTAFKAQQACRFDATAGAAGTASIQAGPEGLRLMVFTGKMTKEKIVWHGPFVCSSKQQVMELFQNYQRGKFPPVRVPWDYRDVSQHQKK